MVYYKFTQEISVVYIPSDASAIELPTHVLEQVRAMDTEFGAPSLDWQTYHLSNAGDEQQ